MATKLKLVYEKKVSETVGEETTEVRHLFGSETGIPSEDDIQVEFDPAYNAEEHIYFYTKSAVDGIRTMGVNDSLRQIPTEEDEEMTATCDGVDVINNVEVSSEDEPSEDEPSEDEPSEDEPSEDEPSEDEPSEDTNEVEAN